jgi:hypothetical protein
VSWEKLFVGFDGKDTNVGPEQADLAMVWLQKAIAAGFKDKTKLKEDKDLDALRNRDDFKKLLADLGA